MLQKLVFFFPLKAVCFFFLFSFCFALLAVYSQNAPKQNTAEIITLEEGKSVERGFAGEAERNHVYQIALSAGQYACVTIERQDADVLILVFAPDGKLIFETQTKADAHNLKKIELVADASGDYKIEIAPNLPKIFTGKYSIRLTEKRTATENEKLLDEARRDYYESLQLNLAGNFNDSLKLANHSLEISEKILGADGADTATMLAVSRAYLAKNNLAQAEDFARRAMEAAAKVSGAESLSYADALTVLARIRQAQANYAEAETLNKQALAVREKAASENSLAVADSLNNLGVLYRAMNNYTEAERSFTKALTIYEKLLGDNRFETALLLNNFGMFYYGAGDYEKAIALLQRSLTIKEKAFPPVHRQIAVAYNNLGLIAWKKGDEEKAKTYYQRALNIYEKVNGPESETVADVLGNLGIIYKEFDADFAKAEEFYKRQLAIREKTSGEYNQATANVFSSLAILYRAMGDYERAEQYGLRAFAIFEKVLGEYNQLTLYALENLVKIYAAKGDAKRALEYAKRRSDIHEKVIPLNLRIGSERQKIAYYNLTQRFDHTINLHVNLARDDDAARDLAVTAILRHKGRVLDAVSENLSALRNRFNAEDQKLLDDLNAVNARLSKAMSSSPQKVSADEKQKQIEALGIERENLESEISRRSAGFYEPSQPVTLDAVRAAIPADAALVEFAVYRPFDWKAPSDEKGFGEPHYIVYVVRPATNEIGWKDLGAAKTIDAVIDEFRNVLRDQKKDVQKSARTLDAQIMQPVRALLGDKKKILISPDGELNLIPFEALVNEKNQFLIENYSFTYLTSGRDLLRMQTARASKSNPLLIANPLFGSSVSEQTIAAVNKSAKIPIATVNRKSVTATRSLSDTYFAPLGATIQEARSIQMLFPDAAFLSGAQATETALKQANAPQILHIATHGFFLEDKDSSGDKLRAAMRNAKEDAESENPLLRSGLALAGANQHKAEGDDGILTALEASGLNLWGTKLVVLSACDTGLGEVKNGEGVYGLRRAFVLAGAETLMMSLWSVSDYATRELMTNYYKNLKQGMKRGEALRTAQLAMLKKTGREHPFYWAGFIQSGEWANLDGTR